LEAKLIPVLIHQDQQVYLIRLANDSGMQVELSNYGGLIKSLFVPDKNGHPVDVVLGFDNLSDYFSTEYLANYPYFGTIIGRYANRIGQASYTHQGNTYKLSVNAAPHQIHGGTEGFDKKVWKIKSLTQTPEPELILTYTSPDGEEGFPGNVKFELSFTLTNNNELKLAMLATTDQETATNLTHHGYFNLNGDGGSIASHYLQLNADQYLAQHPDFLPTGELLPVKGTPKDFTQPKQIGQDWDPENGYDQAFILRDTLLSQAAAVAYSDQSGIQLELFTNRPAIQFYTSKHLVPIKGKRGLMYQPFSGFCLEDQVHPNAINIPHFPNTLLKPGETYNHQTIYRFSTKS